jgi:DNA-binding transcriptional LysR family regulator
MNLDRLLAIETFVRVVDTGSFSAAARIQNIGQPAVSKVIAQLEEWLGVRLLLRSTRGLTPTEAGRSFYERARRTIEEADEAVLAARGTAAGLSGRVRVSAAVCFARLHILPKLPAFLAAHPNIEVDLLLDDRNVDLVEEGVDVALRMGPLTDPGMTVRKIAERPRLVIATPEYFRLRGRPKTPADLIGHQAVIYTRDQGGGEAFTFSRGTEQTSVDLSGRVRVSATEGLRAAIFAGIGLTVASEFAFSPELRTGEVVTALVDWVLPPISLSAVYPTGRMASTKARAFVSFVEECLKV